MFRMPVDGECYFSRPMRGQSSVIACAKMAAGPYYKTGERDLGYNWIARQTLCLQTDFGLFIRLIAFFLQTDENINRADDDVLLGQRPSGGYNTHVLVWCCLVGQPTNKVVSLFVNCACVIICITPYHMHSHTYWHNCAYVLTA